MGRIFGLPSCNSLEALQQSKNTKRKKRCPFLVYKGRRQEDHDLLSRQGVLYFSIHNFKKFKVAFWDFLDIRPKKVFKV